MNVCAGSNQAILDFRALTCKPRLSTFYLQSSILNPPSSILHPQSSILNHPSSILDPPASSTGGASKSWPKQTSFKSFFIESFRTKPESGLIQSVAESFSS